MKKWNYERELIVARQDEAYHRKKMEYFQEEIKLFEQKTKQKSRVRKKK